MRLEPKQVYQELKQGYFWPVYYIFGPERLLIRQLLTEFRGRLTQQNPWAEEKLDGAGISGVDILSAAQSVPFGGGTRLVVVLNAHLVKEPECLSGLFAPRAKAGEVPSVCILIAKDLDARKKFSKQLLEKAAVVPCEAVPEDQREKWISYLAVKLGIKPEDLPIQALVRGEPWSLELVESELIKWALAEQVEVGLGTSVLTGGSEIHVNSERFVESFIEKRDKKSSLLWVKLIGKNTEDALPLVGLLSWNVRMLALLSAKSRSVRLAPFLEGKLLRALKNWKPAEIQKLQSELSKLDFSLKQTPQEPLALWGVLISEFCRD